MDKNPKHPLKKKQAKDKQKRNMYMNSRYIRFPTGATVLVGNFFCFGILDCNGVGIDKDLPFM